MSKYINNKCCYCFVNTLVDAEAYLRDFKLYLRRKLSCKKIPRRNVVLLVVGLDNAGKSAIVNYLFNKSLLTKENVVPTIGFRTVTFKYKKRYTIRMYDVGGSPQIRALWPKYYGDVHGIIYVVDSSDHQRVKENAEVFQELVCHELVREKPILFLGNKQDLRGALNEPDLIDFMNVERVVNFVKCYTRVEVCTCYPHDNGFFSWNKNIDIGFNWLMEEIDLYYDELEEDIAESKKKCKLQRTHTLKSWAGERVDDSSDTDSDMYIQPIVPKRDLLPTPEPKKKRRFKNIFSRYKNRTAPMPDSSIPTAKTMKELIKNMKIEDLIRNTRIEENSLTEFRRPRRWRGKRPNTAPANIKIIEVHPAQIIELETVPPTS